MEVISIKPLLAILVSSIAGLLILFAGRDPNTRESFSVGAGVIKFLLVVSMAPVVLSGGEVRFTLVELFQGVSIAFRVDALALVFATASSFLWILTTFYAAGYMRGLNEHAQNRFFACFAVSLSAALGIAFAANLFTLFLFYEILSLVTYPLVIHKETPESYAAGRKYVVYLVGSSKVFLLAGILLVYVLAGTTEFARGGILPMEANPVLLGVMLLLFVYGFTKAAVMPLHNWLPTAMIAPTPVSALLHAVAVVKAGVFGITRVVVDVFGVDLLASLDMTTVVAVLASFTILMASVLALAQENLKLRLAYSTVSQLSYVILGVVLLTPSAMTGGMMQIANHAFAKITLFFCAGAIYVASHKQNISELSGIAKRMPYTMAAFTIGALSLIGVPPLAGFVSKWYLAVGALEANAIPFLLVLLGSTMLNAAYFLPIIYKAYFEPVPILDYGKDGGTHEHGEAPMLCVVPILITAAGTILLGLFPDYFLTLAQIVLAP